MDSFSTPFKAAVIGASGGIGSALTHALAAHPACGSVHAYARRAVAFTEPTIIFRHLDLTEEPEIEETAALSAKDEPFDLVIVAVGLLHKEGGPSPEKTWAHLTAEAMVEVMQINTIGPALAAKAFLPRLARGRKSVFAAISARVGSISDNRLGGWVSYRASKAALNQVIQTFSVELARKNPDAIIAGLHPGTVATDLSGPFQANVADGKLFTPEKSAAHLLNVVNGLTPPDSGGCFAWDGARVPA